MNNSYRKIVTMLCCITLLTTVHAQNKVLVNMAPVDGLEITPDNILSFQVQSSMSRSSNTLFKGSIIYKNSNLRINFEFTYNLQPGMNIIPAGSISPRYTYSSTGLKELFETYKKLPQGIYEYCVTVRPDYQQSEIGVEDYTECVYHKSEDIFLINLLDPENDAKIYEYNPMLSWTVNYPFASELKYRIRVAEIKKGQNTVTAITRNNPVYDDKNLMQTSIIYPVYGKPLVKDQPYAWTVDAYYKGILLGGAEPWKFTIIEDSLLVGIPTNQSYYEFAASDIKGTLYAVDTLKLKYRSFDNADTLSFVIRDESDKEVKYKKSEQALSPGLNYIDLPFETTTSLKHQKKYKISIKNKQGKGFEVPFTYIRSIYLKNQTQK